MKNYILLLIFLSINVFSQDTIKLTAKLDSIKKYQLIYTYVTETKSFTNYETQSGKKAGSTSTRGIFIDFRVGEEGPIKNIGRRGKSLAKIIKNDAEAYKEFNIAYKTHLRKKRIFNALEYFGYVVAAGSAVALFIGADDYETDGITGLAIAGGAGVIVGFVDILGFHKLTDDEMDKFSASIQKAINIYNNNLIIKKK